MVKAKGEKCKTDASGTARSPSRSWAPDKFDAVAKTKEYADGSVRLKVK